MTALLEYSLSLTVTAIILLIFKRMFQKKISAKWQVLLWGLLLIRFLVPSLPQSEISVFNAIPTPQTVINHQTEPKGFTQMGPTSPEKIPASDVMPKEEPEKHSLEPLVVPVWIAGSVTLLTYFLLVYGFHLQKIRRLPKITDDTTLSLLTECKQVFQIQTKVTLCRGEATPMLAGLLQPRILLPDGYTDEETRSILLHELCHLKHQDILILWCSILLLCVQWFNPVIWYSFFVLRRDLEVYCDDRVLCHIENKKEYATLLLKTALRKNRFLAGTTSLQNGEKEVQRRIRYIAQFRKPKVIWSVVLVLLGIIITAVCLTNSAPNYRMSEAEYAEYINRPMGAIMAELDYADEDIAVFHYLDGFFVYDIRHDKMLHKFDLSKFNCAPHSQGEVALSVSVSDDGKTALLTNFGAENQISQLDSYLIHLQSGKVKQTGQKSLSNPVSRQQTQPLVPTGEGWLSDLCIVQGETVYYLTYQKGAVDDIHLVKRTGDAKDEYYPFHSQLYSYAGNGFHFFSKAITLIAYDFPGYEEELSGEKALGIAELVTLPNLTERSSINNHSENMTLTPLSGYDYNIYQVTETQGYPAASSKTETHRMTMYFLEYPTKVDTYVVLFFQTGVFTDAEVDIMLKSFTFSPVPELISNAVRNHLRPGESIMVNSGMAWHIILEEKDLPEIEKLIRLSGYDPDFSVKSMDERRIFDREKFLGKNLYFYVLEIEKEDGTTYPKLFIFNYDTAELLLSSPFSRERGMEAQQLFIKLNAFTASEVKSALYVLTKQYLESEYIKAFSPYYQCLSQEIQNWQESGNEATFTYLTTDQHWNRDPDRVDYIVKEKNAGNTAKYERLKEQYLSPIQSIYEFRIVWQGDSPTLYHNSAPMGVEWTPVRLTDFVGEMPRQ